jgi:hypothetical protein
MVAGCVGFSRQIGLFQETTIIYLQGYCIIVLYLVICVAARPQEYSPNLTNQAMVN